MNLRRRRKRNEGDTDLTMAPLIDAVFLLLIFFLVATMIRKEDKDIDVALPASVSDKKLLPDDDLLVLGIDAGGNLFFEGAPTSLHLLHQQLGDVAIQSPGRRIRLDADRETPFERVAEILNALQFRHLHNVGIRTYDPSYNRR